RRVIVAPGDRAGRDVEREGLTGRLSVGGAGKGACGEGDDGEFQAVDHRRSPQAVSGGGTIETPAAWRRMVDFKGRPRNDLPVILAREPPSASTGDPDDLQQQLAGCEGLRHK